MSGQQADSPVIAPSHRMLAAVVLALANFMVILDLTIANVSVPHIAGDMGITLEQGTWIITGYAVAEAMSVPLTGWLAQRFGTVRMFAAGMIGFGAFSLLCGLSTTLTMLVVCRIGQGLCGGPIMPLSQTLLYRIFPPEQRAGVMGLWMTTTMLGPALGPIIGGGISDGWSWHWIFFINLPVAIACIFAALTLLRRAETPTVRLPIDRVGLVLLVFWIGSLQIMLDTGRDHDWFADPKIVLLAICAGVGFIAFIIWELTEDHPIVDIRVFRHWALSSGMLIFTLAFGAFFATVVIVPQWLQSSLGYTATQAGIVTASSSIGSVATAMIVLRLMKHFDERILIFCGILWLGVTALVRARWVTGGDFWTFVLPQLAQGFSVPFFMIPLTTLMLGSVPASETASVAGLQNFLRTVALAVATSVVLTLWGNAQRVAQTEIADRLAPQEVQRQLADAGFGPEQSRQMIAGIANQEAVTMALNHVFLLIAFVVALAAIVVWFIPRTRAPVDMSAVH
ncbi:DHA2 family efflux MFS transporter permease subunit [Sphingobium sp. AN641]|uniref:DHA2 family efflux MFS transporter permease subunit n=1 Tax=Sphingobium sp. AN641 TaxID=3133443 RepID=UPI0030C3B67A